MSKLGLVFLLIGSFVFSDVQIPNELTFEIKGVKKFSTTLLSFTGVDISAKLSPHDGRLLALLEIPVTLSEDELLQEVKKKFLSPAFSFRRSRAGQYELTYEGRLVEEASAKFFQDELSKALALQIPKNAGPHRFNSNQPSKLILKGSLLTEYRDRGSKPVRMRYFPKSSELPSLRVVDLKPKAATKGGIEKFNLPSGTFADQIKVDPHGDIWYTEPFDNRVTRFRYATKEWFHKTVGKGPDGLGLDRMGRLWFGEYFDQALGVYDPASDKYQQFKMTYPKPTPAIPYEDAQGTIWFTDHVANRLVKFDPVNHKAKDFEVPSKGAWIVDIMQTEDKSVVYFNETNTNKMGKFHIETEKFEEFSVSSTKGPTFLATDGRLLWISEWNFKGFVVYDTVEKTSTEYILEASPGVGPLALREDGKLCIGNLSGGIVYLVDIQTRETIFHQGVDGLKDGLTYHPDGSCWASGNKFISRVTFE